MLSISWRAVIAESAGGAGLLAQFNWLDIAVAVIFAVCIFIGYRKGLIKAVFDLFSMVISLFIANKLYPLVSVVLREKSGVYVRVKENIAGTMHLEQMVQDTTLAAQEQFINNLPLPDFLAERLLENNNPEIYGILNVSTIEDYIGGYIANIFINILSAVLVFLLVFLIMKAAAKALDLVSKLPVIHQFNKTGGLIAGAVTGLVYIWIGLIIYTMFFVNPDNNSMDTLYASKIAVVLYQNNYLIYALLRIFA